MAYPPALPDAGSTNATPSTDVHPALHNATRAAFDAIIAELGTQPRGDAADLTARLLSIETDLAAVGSSGEVAALSDDVAALSATVATLTSNVSDLTTALADKADLAEVVTARAGLTSLADRLNRDFSSRPVRVVSDDASYVPVRPDGATFVDWWTISDPSSSAAQATWDTWSKLTFGTSGGGGGGGGGGSTWNNWDPTSSTTPPLLTSYPDFTNTGIPPGTGTLTVMSGTQTLTPGATYDKIDFTGTVIGASNALVKRCRIRNRLDGANGLKIWACDWGRLAGVDATTTNGMRFNAAEIKRCNIYGWTDLLQLNNGSGVEMLIQDNFLHDAAAGHDSGQTSSTDPVYGTALWSHNDCIQLILGGNYRIKHNTMFAWTFFSTTGETLTAGVAGPHWFNSSRSGSFREGFQTSAILINSGAGIHDVTIEDNLIRGHASKYIHTGGNAPVTIQRNRFGRESRDYPLLISGTYTDGGGNVYNDTGTPI